MKVDERRSSNQVKMARLPQGTTEHGQLPTTGHKALSNDSSARTAYAKAGHNGQAAPPSRADERRLSNNNASGLTATGRPESRLLPRNSGGMLSPRSSGGHAYIDSLTSDTLRRSNNARSGGGAAGHPHGGGHHMGEHMPWDTGPFMHGSQDPWAADMGGARQSSSLGMRGTVGRSSGPNAFESDGRPGTRGGGPAYELDGRPLSRGGARPPSRLQMGMGSIKRQSGDYTGLPSHSSVPPSSAHLAPLPPGTITLTASSTGGLGNTTRRPPALNHEKAPAGPLSATPPPPSAASKSQQQGPAATNRSHKEANAASAAPAKAKAAPPPSPPAMPTAFAQQQMSRASGGAGGRPAPADRDIEDLIDTLSDTDETPRVTMNGGRPSTHELEELNKFLSRADFEDELFARQRATRHSDGSSAPSLSPSTSKGGAYPPDQLMSPSHHQAVPEKYRGMNKKAVQIALKVLDRAISHAVRTAEINKLILATEARAIKEDVSVDRGGGHGDLRKQLCGGAGDMSRHSSVTSGSGKLVPSTAHLQPLAAPSATALIRNPLLSPGSGGGANKLPRAAAELTAVAGVPGTGRYATQRLH